MHPKKLIDTVVHFEKDLAAFYLRLEKLERFKELKRVLQFMNRHSDIHAELIRNFRSEISLPMLDIGPLEELHTRIKSALADQLTATEDLNEVFENLAHAETIISKVYTTIADHYEKTSHAYTQLSQIFKNLADDEMRHHDHIQKEKTLYSKTKKIGSTLQTDSGRRSN